MKALRLGLLFLLSPYLFAEDPPLDWENLDLLLEEPQDENQEEPISSDLDALLDQGDENNIEQNNQGSTLLDELFQEQKLQIKVNLSGSLGYSPGVFYQQDENQEEELIWDQLPVMELNSSLSLNIPLHRQLSFYQNWSVNYPDFELKAKEIFFDYSWNEKLFLRAGRQNLTWGESRNFDHTNLHARIPEGDFSGTENLSARLSIPVSAGSVDFLALTRRGYWDSSADSPSMDDMGWGLRVNIPLGNFDSHLQGFYHPDLHVRGSGGFKTTFFSRLECYGEALVSWDPQGEDLELPDGKRDNPLDYSINLGLYQDFLGGRLAFMGEYFFNGEESQLDTIGGEFDLIYGHNAAILIDYSLQNSPVNLKVYSRYNYQSYHEQSLLLMPGISWNFTDLLNLQAGGIYVFGEDSQGYMDANPDPEDRRGALFIRVKLSADWKGEL